jgi:hypothetical protein
MEHWKWRMVLIARLILARWALRQSPDLAILALFEHIF